MPTLEELGAEGPALVVRSGGGRAGEHFVPQGERTTIGRSPDCDIFLDDVTVSRKHAVLVQKDGALLHRGPGEPERHLPEPPPDRVRSAGERRRAPDRQVQAQLPREVSTAEAPTERARLLTIGTVCTRLQPEFPDISISKIRYLEDQGLLAPRRTQSGYRLFSEDDVERLETILRLQRDEFLPLRVIRQELASPSGAGKERRRRRAVGLADPDDELDLGELCERAAITSELARELEEYGLLQPRARGRREALPGRGRRVAVACAKLARFGISARHLRTFRTAADREAGLLEQLVAPVAALAQPGAARRGACSSSRRSPSSPRSSRSCSSGATCGTSRGTDGRRRT